MLVETQSRSAWVSVRETTCFRIVRAHCFKRNDLWQNKPLACLVASKGLSRLIAGCLYSICGQFEALAKLLELDVQRCCLEIISTCRLTRLGQQKRANTVSAALFLFQDLIEGVDLHRLCVGGGLIVCRGFRQGFQDSKMFRIRDCPPLLDLALAKIAQYVVATTY